MVTPNPMVTSMGSPSALARASEGPWEGPDVAARRRGEAYKDAAHRGDGEYWPDVGRYLSDDP